MKKSVVIIALCLSMIHVHAQSVEARQLMLNVEKLAQLKKILKGMYDGYKIISEGYTAVKDLSKGNFTLHKAFLDGLLEVSPGVQKYRRIDDIYNYQRRILKENKTAYNRFREEGVFSASEIEYLGQVYSNLFHESLKSLEELSMIITSGRLRMSDDERLRAIDRIYESVVDEYAFLNEFNNNTLMLSLQRKSEQAEIKRSKIVYGLRK